MHHLATASLYQLHRDTKNASSHYCITVSVASWYNKCIISLLHLCISCIAIQQMHHLVTTSLVTVTSRYNKCFISLVHHCDRYTRYNCIILHCCDNCWDMYKNCIFALCNYKWKKDENTLFIYCTFSLWNCVMHWCWVWVMIFHLFGCFYCLCWMRECRLGNADVQFWVR